MEQNLVLGQRQVLSQKMIQSLEILQMNTQELEAFLEKEVMENPMLELEEEYETGDEKLKVSKKLEWLRRSDEQNRIYYGQDHSEAYEKEYFQDRQQEFETYILSQLIEEFQSNRDRDIYTILVYSLDERGYLPEIPEILRENWGLEEKQIEIYVDKLKECEPAGVGAVNLEECLWLQLQRKDMLGGLEEKIVEEYLVYIAKNQIKEISKALKVSLEDVSRAVKNIKALNPKPAQGFASRENLKYLYPDLSIVKFEDYFEIVVDGESRFTPNINSYYMEMMKKATGDEVKKYLEDKYRQAEWLIQCISSRKETLIKIAKVLIEKQQDFFEKGKGYLKPLRMSQVAEEIGIHESTVSRGIRDKYIQCIWGIYPMSYFFARGTLADETPERIKEYIKECVEREDKKKPLSDQKIADRINGYGVPVARRTIAKYRVEMEIRDAKSRKEF